jgi:hypothetical protein
MRQAADPGIVDRHIVCEQSVNCVGCKIVGPREVNNCLAVQVQADDDIVRNYDLACSGSKW